jgi:uncharacterized membrane protein YbaN (DUF454 family)
MVEKFVLTRTRRKRLTPFVRKLLVAFGWFNVGLAVIGAVLPVMPTTEFLLIALWAFSMSSKRFHRWLYEHPTFGQIIHAWQDQRRVPWSGKITAVLAMSASLYYVTQFIATDWRLPCFLGLLFSVVAARLFRFHSSPANDI